MLLIIKKTLLILFIGVSINTFSQENIRFSETINTKDLQRHLAILASDSLEGRETGQKGQKMAADYIMNHFKNIGIRLETKNFGMPGYQYFKLWHHNQKYIQKSC